MATVKRFGKIKVCIFPADHNPPHCHIMFQGQSCLVTLADGQILSGSLPRGSEEALVWTRDNLSSLMNLWNQLNP